MAFTSGNDVNALQATDTGNVGAGAGNDRYIVSGDLITANQQITITDTEGSNVIQLVTGLSITSSSVTSNAAQLTLSNGAVITILGADTFSYLLGGDPLTGVGGTTQTFAEVAANQLGVAAIPAAGAPAATGTPNVVGGSSTFALAAGAANVDEGSTATFTLTTTGVADGTAVPYTITGVSAADVTGGLTGSATVTGNTATISVPLVADVATEGAETLTVTIDGQATATASTIVNDTSVPSQNLVTTINPDALTGGGGDDTFIASDATLSAADLLDGAGGTDTLRYASSGTVLVNESGFTAKNIENLEIIADNSAGTVFDVSGVAGVQKVTNTNSSGNLTLNGATGIYDLELRDVSGGNTISDYVASVVTGTADTQKVVLDSVVSNAGTAVSSLTVDPGIETVAITTEDGGSKLTSLIATGASKITVAGDQALSIGGTLTASTVDASASTGAVTVGVDGSKTLDVKGGTGNDTVSVANSLSAGDKLDGGAGTDTLSVLDAQANAGFGTAAVTNFEQLGVSDAADGTIDMDNFAGFSKVILDGGLKGDTTVDDAVTGISVEVDQPTAATDDLVVDLKVDGAADEITILFDDIDNADVMGTVTADDAETLNFNGSKLATGTSQDLTIAKLNAADATTLNITSDALLDFSDTNTTNLKTVNAAASTGNLDLEELDLAAAGATVVLGAGADTIESGAGGDTLTGGGGADHFKYTNANQSDNAGTDTIKDFVSGTDTIDLKSLAAGAVTAASQFKGVFGDFGSAQGALSGSAGTKVPGDAVFEANFDGNGNGRLWVDIDGDGTLSNTDLRIVLEGVSTIKAADLGIGVSGNGIDLTATDATVNTSTSTNATNPTTNNDDTITASASDLANSSIDGALGNDTLTISDNASAITSLTTESATGANLDNVENVVFNNTTGTINLAGNNNGENITVNGANGALTVTALTTANGGDNQTFVVNNTTAAGNVSNITFAAAVKQKATTGSANDTFNAIQNGDETIASGAGDDTFNVLDDADFVSTLTIDGGAGTDKIVLTDGNAGTMSLVTPAFTNIEAFDAGTIATGTTLNVTLDTGFTTLTADNDGTGVTNFVGTGAQLSSLTSVTRVDGDGDLDFTVSDASATVDFTNLNGITTTNEIEDLIFTGNNNILKIDDAIDNAFQNAVTAAGTGDVLQVNDVLTGGIDGADFDAFETITITGSAVNILVNDVNTNQTINGEAGNNDIVLADTQASNNTVNISQGGADRVSFDGAGDDTAANHTTVSGFTVGVVANTSDVIDLNTSNAIGSDVVTTASIAATGVTVDSQTAANAIDTAYVFSSSAFQVSGSLESVADAGAVEAAILAAGIVFSAGDGVDEQAADGHFYAVLDNGTDTGIYRVATANANIADLNLNAANEFSVDLVGVVQGLSDAGTLVAANIV